MAIWLQCVIQTPSGVLRVGAIQPDMHIVQGELQRAPVRRVGGLAIGRGREAIQGSG